MLSFIAGLLGGVAVVVLERWIQERKDTTITGGLNVAPSCDNWQPPPSIVDEEYGREMERWLRLAQEAREAERLADQAHRAALAQINTVR